MAFSIILWVSWISLLSRCTCVSAGNGVQYRPTHAATNLIDDQHEDRFNTMSFDEGNFDEPSTNQPTSDFYASFNKPSVGEPLQLVPSGQRFPEYQSIPNLAVFSRESNLVDPITFPLNQGNQMAGLTPSKPDSVQPQSNPFSAYSGTGSADLLTHFKPSRTFTSLSLLPPKVQPKQPATPESEAVMSAVRYQQPNTVSSPSNFGSKENSNQFFEGLFNFNMGDTGTSSTSDLTPLQEFPSYSSKPSKPSQSYPSLDTGRWYSGSNDVNRPWIGDMIPQKKLPMRHFLNSAEPQSSGQSNSIDPGSSSYATPTWKVADEDWMFSFFPKVFDNPSFDFYSNYQPKKSASVQMDKVSKVYQPARSLKPLKKRIVHSKNGYKRGRFVMSKTAYTPEYQTAPINNAMVLKPVQQQPRKWPNDIKI